MKAFVQASYLLSGRSLQPRTRVCLHWRLHFKHFFTGPKPLRQSWNIIYIMYNLVSVSLFNQFFHVYDLKVNSERKLLNFKETSLSFCHLMISSKKVSQKSRTHMTKTCSLTYLFSHRISVIGKTFIFRRGQRENNNPKLKYYNLFNLELI